MGLIAQAKADIESITSNLNEFGVSMKFTSPGGETATITGLHTKHHLGIDTDGNAENTKKAHASFSEKFLLNAGYPVRNSAGEVNLTGHKVEVADSTGVTKTYMVQQWFPDETLGHIVCILEDYG